MPNSRTASMPLRACLCAATLLLAACGEASLGSSTAGSWVRSGDLGIMGGAGAWRSDRPGVFFGAVDTPDLGQRLSYLAFFEHPIATQAGWRSDATCSASTDGLVATTDHSLGFGGDAFRAAVRVEWDPKQRRASGSLSIDGGEAEFDLGAVFLVDLRGAKRVRRIDVELPQLRLPPFGDARYDDAVQVYAAAVVRALQPRDDVAQFFGRGK